MPAGFDRSYERLNGRKVEVITTGNDRDGWDVNVYAIGEIVPKASGSGKTRNEARAEVGLGPKDWGMV